VASTNRYQGIGYTAITTGELWKDHPEKALLCEQTVDKTPRQAILMAVQSAQQWLLRQKTKEERPRSLPSASG